jgi:HTH-type transcriptional repressor of NAD biosynthesis genes
LKEYRTGLVIGKFWPPHRGHDFLIATASARCQRVIVLVAWHPEQGLDPELRVACLRENHPDADVRAIDDIVPADDSVGWAAYTRWVLGSAPDAVFTSESYGDAYAMAMGSHHVLVDRPRQTVPCSASMIRADPLAHLEWLSPFMRSAYVLRVCTVGAESTGTTTLARALAERYDTAWVPEYGREYCEMKWKDGYTAEWTTEEFKHIARTQAKREDAAARTANRILFCDTDAFATGLWHERYLGRPSPEVEAIAAGRVSDLYFLTGDEIPFVQDGLRDGEHIRHEMHTAFERKLASTGRRYLVVRGPHEERVQKASSHVESLLSRQAVPRWPAWREEIS